MKKFLTVCVLMLVIVAILITLNIAGIAQSALSEGWGVFWLVGQIPTWLGVLIISLAHGLIWLMDYAVGMVLLGIMLLWPFGLGLLILKAHYRFVCGRPRSVLSYLLGGATGIVLVMVIGNIITNILPELAQFFVGTRLLIFRSPSETNLFLTVGRTLAVVFFVAGYTLFVLYPVALFKGWRIRHTELAK